MEEERRGGEEDKRKRGGEEKRRRGGRLFLLLSGPPPIRGGPIRTQTKQLYSKVCEPALLCVCVCVFSEILLFLPSLHPSIPPLPSRLQRVSEGGMEVKTDDGETEEG